MLSIINRKEKKWNIVIKFYLKQKKDLIEFVSITLKLPGRIVVVDGEQMCVNARSILGLMYAMTFSELWCESEEDIYYAISKFIV